MTSAPSARPAAAVFSTLFLQYSQTFVHDEVRLHERYDVEVFTRKRLNPERFPFDPVHVGGLLYELAQWDRGFDARFAARRFALAHGHFGTGSIYAMAYARRFDLPLVVTFHGYDVPLLTSWHRFEPRFLRYGLLGPRLLRAMTLGLCASEELRTMLLAIGVPDDRLRVHRTGVDLERFSVAGRSSAAELRVVMVGRFVEKKGFEYGLRAFAECAREAPMRLTLVGEGDLEARLRAVARELGVEDRVSFAGVLTPAEVATVLANSDVLLAPSVVASFGNRESGLLTVKEASAAGAVPIGTLHGGIPEIIDDGVTGFLVPEHDAGSLADRLRRLRDDPALRGRLSSAGREKMMREYDARARVRALEEHYDEAVSRHREGRAGASG